MAIGLQWLLHAAVQVVSLSHKLCGFLLNYGGIPKKQEFLRQKLGPDPFLRPKF